MSLTTETAISLDPDGAGFKINKSALTPVAEVAGLDRPTVDKLGDAAEKGLPGVEALQGRDRAHEDLEVGGR